MTVVDRERTEILLLVYDLCFNPHSLIMFDNQEGKESASNTRLTPFPRHNNNRDSFLTNKLTN